MSSSHRRIYTTSSSSSHNNEFMDDDTNQTAIDDIFSYMCSLAVSKCAKKAEKKKASCGGAAMRKRLLIKNFVSQMLDQERKMTQTGREKLSREVNIPAPSRKSSLFGKPPTTPLSPHSQDYVQDDEEEEEEEEEDQLDVSAEDQTLDQMHDNFRSADLEQHNPAASDGEGAQEDEEDDEDGELDDEEDYDRVSVFRRRLPHLGPHRRATHPPTSASPPLLPDISTLDVQSGGGGFSNSVPFSMADPSCVGLATTTSTFCNVGMVVVEEEGGARDTQNDVAPPSWHESEPDLFMLERSASAPLYNYDVSVGAAGIVGVDAGVPPTNNMSELGYPHHYPPAPGTADFYGASSASLPLHHHLHTGAMNPPSNGADISSTLHGQLPENFMDEASEVSATDDDRCPAHLATSNTADVDASAITTTYAELQTTTLTTTATAFDGASAGNTTLLSNTSRCEYNTASEYRSGVNSSTRGRGVCCMEDKATSLSQADDDEEEEEDDDGEQQDNHLASPAVSTFVDFINMSPTPMKLTSDCRTEALTFGIIHHRHITDLDTHLTTMIEEEDEVVGFASIGDHQLHVSHHYNSHHLVSSDTLATSVSLLDASSSYDIHHNQHHHHTLADLISGHHHAPSPYSTGALNSSTTTTITLNSYAPVSGANTPSNPLDSHHHLGRSPRKRPTTQQLISDYANSPLMLPLSPKRIKL